MKQIKLNFIIVLLVLVGINSNAQVSNYQFNSTTGFYTELIGGTVLKTANCTQSIDTLITNINIGFNFNYNGNVYSTVGIANNGYIWFGTGTPTATVYTPVSGSLGTNIDGLIAGIGRRLVARNASPCGEISVLTSGIAGAQTFAVQYKNYRGASVGTSAIYNFQIKLYETSNIIEVDYGTFTMTGATATTCEVGLRGASNSDYNNRTTGWANSTPGTANNNTLALSQTVFPSSGLVYIWTPPAACSGTPSAGIVSSSSSTYCYNSVATLNLQGQTMASGISIVWEKSIDSTNWVSMSSVINSTTDTVKQLQYYRAIVTCSNSGDSDTSNVYTVNLKPTYECYCTPTHTDAACNNGGYIDTVFISNTNFSNSTACDQLSGTAYSLYDSTVTTAHLTAGNSYTIGVRSTSANNFSVWIDYDQNGLYDATEWTQISANATANTITTATINIPNNATTGTTGMRIRSRGTTGSNTSTDACTQFASGETEDYVISILPGTACTNPPTAGNTLLNIADSVCSGTAFQASLSGNSTGSGQTYQWQTSTDNNNWTDVTGETNLTYNDTVNSLIYIRCNVTCGTTVSSTEISANILPATLCYCLPASTNNNCGNGGFIDSVSISNTNFVNNSACDQTDGTAYSKYPSTGNTTTSLNAGDTYSFNVRTTGANKVSVWIDYDQNGSFDANEWTQITNASTANVVSSANVTIPVNALGGLTGMRIRSRNTNGSNIGTDACAQFGSGETEDYLITIVPASPCQNPPTAGATTSSTSLACSGTTFQANLTGNSSGVGQTYQWQSSLDGNNWIDITGETSTSLTDTLLSPVYIRCNVTCGVTVSSDSIFIDTKPANTCYCIPPSTNNNCTNSGFIDSVSIDNTNFVNVSACDQLNGTAYSQYPETGSTTTSLRAGANYKINVRTTSTNNISVWIDYDQNGVFDASEWTEVTASSQANIVNSSIINIPFTALTGKTGMRIRSRSTSGSNTATDACTQFGSGEAEDYMITILPAPDFDLGIVNKTKPTLKNCYGMDTLTVILRNNGINPIDFSTSPANLIATKSNPSSSTSSAQITNGILNSGDTLSVTFPDLFDLSIAGTHIFNVSLDQFVDSNLIDNQLSFTVLSTNPSASIIGDTTLCDSTNTVLLQGFGTGDGGFFGLNYSWSTGDNNQNTSVTPTTTTTYTLTVSDINNCSAQATATITVINKPLIEINGDTLACKGSSITLTATGGTSYFWNTGSTSNSTSVLIDTTQAIIVEGNDGYCSNNDTIIVVVKELPTIDSSNVLITNSNCNQSDGSIVGITANGSGSLNYFWFNAINDTIATSADLTNVSFGNYSLIVTDDFCTSQTLTLSISNIGAPNAPQSPSPQTICLGSNAVLIAAASQNGNLSWYSDAGLTQLIGTGTQTTVTPTSNTNYYVVEELSGCISLPGTYTVNVDGVYPFADFSWNQINDSTISFTNNSTNYLTFNWNFGDGNTNSDTLNPIHTYTSAGSYSVTLTLNNTCFSDDTTIVVDLIPTVNRNDVTSKIVLYPNPVKDQLIVKNANNTYLNITITDNVGKIIYKTVDNKNLISIPFTSYSNGIYLININNKHYKIVKE